MDNVLANAVVHNPPGTHITIRAEQGKNGSWELRVQDDGSGMDKETKQNLFERYYRGTNTEDGPDGTGLGLSIAHQIVRAHDGRIQVDSAPEKGTVVSMMFPQHHGASKNVP